MDNPYSAPDANVRDPSDQPPTRPVLVWVIAVYAALGVIGGIASVVMLMTGRIPIVNEAQRAYMQSMTPFDHALTLICFLLYAIGALYLFRLKKVAARILAVYGVALAGTTAYFYTKPAYRDFMASVPQIGTYLGWTISLAIIAYAFKLRRDGVLQ